MLLVWSISSTSLSLALGLGGPPRQPFSSCRSPPRHRSPMFSLPGRNRSAGEKEMMMVTMIGMERDWLWLCLFPSAITWHIQCEALCEHVTPVVCATCYRVIQPKCIFPDPPYFLYTCTYPKTIWGGNSHKW